MTKLKGLIGWDNKGTLQHMAKMGYLSERGERLEILAVSGVWCACSGAKTSGRIV